MRDSPRQSPVQRHQSSSPCADMRLHFFLCVSAAPPTDSSPHALASPTSDLVAEISHTIQQQAAKEMKSNCWRSAAVLSVFRGTCWRRWSLWLEKSVWLTCAEVPLSYWSELSHGVKVWSWWRVLFLDKKNQTKLPDSHEEKTDGSEQPVQTSTDVVCSDGAADATCPTVCTTLTVSGPVLLHEGDLWCCFTWF